MANAKLGTKAVGSIVKLKVNSAAKEFIVVHQGKPSSLYDNSCDGTWLLMKDIYENRQWHNSNVNNLENSTIHSYLNGTFLNLFESNIRDAIKQVKLPYRKNGGSGGSDQSGANGLSAKIFLLSGYEVGYTVSISSYFPVDGAKLSYFESGVSSSAMNKRIAYLNGSVFGWWLRSPYTKDTSSEWFITTLGGGNVSGTSSPTGVRPALILPPDMEVDSSGNVTPPPPATHKTLVNGTVYEVKGGKCLVNGTVYSIKKGRTLINGTGHDITFARSYDSVFANNTWKQIIEACHYNEVPDTWKVADYKPMTINGVDYQIDIIGKDHDTYASGGKAPLTFQLHNCYNEGGVMNNSASNSGGWTSCAMRQTQLPAILSQMPTEVQNGIREVNKLTSAGSQSATINTTADKLFLLSEIEIFGRINNSFSGEGTQYDYYKAGNSRVKKFKGRTISWFGRSPSKYVTYGFCTVSNNGTTGYSNASTSAGVAFGFCF